MRIFVSILVCAIVIGTFTGCNNGSASGETSYLDPLIRVDVDSSKTQTVDIDCTITDLLTKEYDQTVGGTRVGYGYSPSIGKVGVGVLYGGSKDVKHIVEYYVTVEDCVGTICRFSIDELDWKSFKEGDTLTIQEVTEHTKSGSPYKPYYAFRGKKLETIQFLNENNEPNALNSDSVNTP